MAHNDDVSRVLAACDACSSVYAARQWPNGDIRIIGQQGCSCGEESFELVDDESSLDIESPSDADSPTNTASPTDIDSSADTESPTDTEME